MTETTTEITLGGANCPSCFNETLEVLRCEPGVVAVDANIGTQCLRVRHHGVAVARLLDVIRRQLHADDTSTSEHVMIEIDPRVADLHCTHSSPRNEQSDV